MLYAGDASEHGFTLIELVIVMIIIGVLAAISIPTFLEERDGASRSAVQSDLRNVAVYAESYYAEHGTYDGFDVNPLFTTFVASPGVVLNIDAADTTHTTFCAQAVHDRLPAGEAWSYQNDRTPRLGNSGC